jgi:malonyl CoA-acyl carrier protein transacylase
MNRKEIESQLDKIGKEEIITLMVDSINKDNRHMCHSAGMPEEQINKYIEQSQESLFFMMSNVFDKLKERGLIA